VEDGGGMALNTKRIGESGTQAWNGEWVEDKGLEGQWHCRTCYWGAQWLVVLKMGRRTKK